MMVSSHKKPTTKEGVIPSTNPFDPRSSEWAFPKNFLMDRTTEANRFNSQNKISQKGIPVYRTGHKLPRG